MSKRTVRIPGFVKEIGMVSSYYECSKCGGRYKRVFGEALLPATGEEFAQMVPE